MAAEDVLTLLGMEFRNPRYSLANGAIDMEINHPIHGWIPTTTMPDDVEEHVRELHARAVAAGGIAPFVPPDQEETRRRMPQLTARQLRLGLLGAGISPSTVTTQIESMAAGTEREAALIEWEYASYYTRTHSLIATLGGLLGLTPEQIDTMWIASADL